MNDNEKLSGDRLLDYVENRDAFQERLIRNSAKPARVVNIDPSWRCATIDDLDDVARAARARKEAETKGILSGGLASFVGPGNGALSGEGRSALRFYANRLANQLTTREQYLLDRDTNAYAREKDRLSDKDAAPVPLYLPSSNITDKIFLDAVQKYLDQGMDFKSAWLAAKAANPVAFRAYIS